MTFRNDYLRLWDYRNRHCRSKGCSRLCRFHGRCGFGGGGGGGILPVGGGGSGVGIGVPNGGLAGIPELGGGGGRLTGKTTMGFATCPWGGTVRVAGTGGAGEMVLS